MDLGTTNWKNPTDEEVHLRLFLAPGQFETYKIAPKGSAAIPSQFTGAIHQCRNGLVVGGYAPQLVREGQTERVHPALVPAAPAVPEKPAAPRK